MASVELTDLQVHPKLQKHFRMTWLLCDIFSRCAMILLTRKSTFNCFMLLLLNSTHMQVGMIGLPGPKELGL